MDSVAVLSALGHDRVGMANDVAKALGGREIRIEDSRMATLKGQFAMMLHLRGKPDEMRRLRGDLTMLSAQLKCHLQLEQIESTRKSSSVPAYVIESHCRGPSGLSAVTAILRRHHVNIEDLKTEAEAVPFSSKMSFHLSARVSVPPSESVAKLRAELKQLERDRNVDIVMTPTMEVVPG